VKGHISSERWFHLANLETWYSAEELRNTTGVPTVNRSGDVHKKLASRGDIMGDLRRNQIHVIESLAEVLHLIATSTSFCQSSRGW
jgi:hypothetical protein